MNKKRQYTHTGKNFRFTVKLTQYWTGHAKLDILCVNNKLGTFSKDVLLGDARAWTAEFRDFLEIAKVEITNFTFGEIVERLRG